MSIKIRSRVFLRVFVLFALLVLTIMLFFAFMVIPMQESALQKTMYTQGLTVSRSIVQATSDAFISKDYGFIVEHNVEVLKNNPSIQSIIITPLTDSVITINQSGWRLLDSIEPHLAQHQTDQIFDLLKGNQWQAEGYHFVYPIIFSGIPWGWLHIEFNTDEYNEYVNDMYFQLIYISAIALIMIIFMGYFFARWVTRPVSIISNLATQVANGNLEVRSKIDRRDEIGVLSKSFNKMVESLQQSKQSLENYNQQLEDEVKKRTIDLDLLNKNLDKKVKQEVSQRQEQERLLIHQSRLAAMGEMIGAIAHQWRQPLNALSLVQQNLYLHFYMGKLTDEFMVRSMEKSERLVSNMSTTIDDFRNFFKPNKHAEYFNINELLRTTVSLLEAQFKNHNIAIKINCKESLTIKGFEGEFSQVIVNLLTNSKDAFIERQIQSPVITINTGVTEKEMYISVHDNGGGIPENIFDKIYDPYFTTKEEGKGTGIGLYMSKMIVENNMRGKFYAVNETDGVTFLIKIPVYSTKPAN